MLFGVSLLQFLLLLLHFVSLPFHLLQPLLRVLQLLLQRSSYRGAVSLLPLLLKLLRLQRRWTEVSAFTGCQQKRKYY